GFERLGDVGRDETDLVLSGVVVEYHALVEVEGREAAGLLEDRSVRHDRWRPWLQDIPEVPATPAFVPVRDEVGRVAQLHVSGTVDKESLDHRRARDGRGGEALPPLDQEGRAPSRFRGGEGGPGGKTVEAVPQGAAPRAVDRRIGEGPGDPYEVAGDASGSHEVGLDPA